MRCPDRPARYTFAPGASRGFTLLELLVAVAVFATVGVLAIGGLRAVLVADHATQEQSQRLTELQVTLAVLERDLRHSIELRPRDGYGDRLPPLRYSSVTEPRQLELVRAGNGEHDRLARVAWRITERGLERVTWPALDGALAESEQVHLFMTPKVRDKGPYSARREETRDPDQELQIRFEFVDGQTQDVADSWPPLDASGRRPTQVIVSLVVPGLGLIERRIALTGVR
ncbi:MULTISPECIES: type II secretion system minor pseudopilin GspJ [unclassified Thioalkalivibrio]|uniref:type II secretion system minor pseudopilin GspJ n=1 Tax=unclassified Thioalkalivibrio TaxID=2621013 RepID=UPI000381ECB3|nr:MULTISPECIES: type II secretion system minor pseudopilin GspJ [unclassified Thioalkalivibrio]